MIAPPSPAALLAALLLGLSTATAVAGAEAPQVSVRLQPAETWVGQRVMLEIEIHTDSLRSPDVEPSFTLENLRLQSGPSESRQIQVRNFEVRRLHGLRWVLEPLAPGTASVRELQLEIGGRSLRLPDQTVTVQEGDPPGGAPSPPTAAAPGSGLRDLWDRFPQLLRRGPSHTELVATASAPRVWQGQQLTCNLDLYTTARVLSSRWQHLPDFPRFWSRDVPLPSPRPKRVVVHRGQPHDTATLQSWALFPLSPGRHTIPSAALELVTEEPADGWLGALRPEPRQFVVESRPLEVEVLPLPPAPAGFSGLVGQWELAAALDPPQVAAGEASILTMTLRGTGNLQGVAQPAVRLPGGLVAHGAADRVSEEFRGGILEGRRTWSLPLVAQRPGEQDLVVAGLVSFDPLSGSYVQQPDIALRLTVDPPPAVPDDGQGADPEAVDARPSALRGMLGAATALAVVCILACGLRAARRRRRLAPLTAGLAAAGRQARPRAAAAAIEEAWRAFLKAGGLEPPATGPDTWPPALLEAGVDAGWVAGLGELLQDLSYLRGAAQLADLSALVAEQERRGRRLAGRWRRPRVPRHRPTGTSE